MDTSTLIALFGIILIGIVVFFVVRTLLVSTFFRPANKKFRPTIESEQESTYPDQLAFLSTSDEFRVVNLPTQRANKPGFSGHGEDINLDGACMLKGRVIRDCYDDCTCELKTLIARSRQNHGRGNGGGFNRGRY